jgi:hypothetical protein
MAKKLSSMSIEDLLKLGDEVAQALRSRASELKVHLARLTRAGKGTPPRKKARRRKR